MVLTDVGVPAAAPVAPPAPTAFLAGKARAADDDFPDLAAAAKVKESKKDKKKKESKNKQTLSLTDFLKSDVGGVGGGGGAFRPSRGGGLGGGGGGGSGGGDVDLLSLPTAPRPRVEGEERPERGMGGGFREYGGNREGAWCGAAPAASCCSACTMQLHNASHAACDSVGSGGAKWCCLRSAALPRGLWN
jgi:hypothetical protein